MKKNPKAVPWIWRYGGCEI